MENGSLRVPTSRLTYSLTHRHQRHLNKARLSRRAIDPLRGLAIVCRLGPEDVLDERLGISIVKREPARLDLNHDPVARQKYVVGCRQGPAIQQGLVSRDRFGRLQ